ISSGHREAAIYRREPGLPGRWRLSRPGTFTGHVVKEYQQKKTEPNEHHSPISVSYKHIPAHQTTKLIWFCVFWL
ncbi:hypothetical protein, partial [Enterobacter asburiae]